MKSALLEARANPKASRLRRILRWSALVAFVIAVAFGKTLPDWLHALLLIFGLGGTFYLLFLVGRHLKNRFFWRVRNRIVGAFVFVGLIPLLLLAGIAVLSGYMLFGQLAANYLDVSLHEISEEQAVIASGIASRWKGLPGAEEFSRVTRKALKDHAAAFPQAQALLVQEVPDGSPVITGRYDLGSDSSTFELEPPGSWLMEKPHFSDVVLRKDKLILLSARLVTSQPSCHLVLISPLEEPIIRRLYEKKNVDVAFLGAGKTRVQGKTGGITFTIGESGNEKLDPQIETQVKTFESRKDMDGRWTITWGSPLEKADYFTGEMKPSSLAILRVPYATVYEAYLTGSYKVGQYILQAVVILLGIFAVVVLFSILVGTLISRRITRAVHDLYLGTLALQKGELQHRIPVRRSDQLGHLALSFNQMSTSIVQLLEEVTEKKRLEQELEIAREVQATLFPKQLPKQRGLVLFGGCEPARTVSGDYYDFIHEDEAHLHIVVGDISGKGISAALLMASLQAAFRSQMESFKLGTDADVERQLAALIEQLNRQIYQNSPSEKYATLFAARYDAESRRLSYANAGHLPPVVLSNGEVLRLEVGGTVIGMFPEMTWNATTIEFAPNSIFAVFTDGVTEAVNAAGEEFGEERLIESLKKARTRPPEEIYRQVISQLQEWQGDLKQHDDITLIVGRVD